MSMNAIRALPFVIFCFAAASPLVESADNKSWIAERCAAYRGYCAVPFQLVLSNSQDLVSMNIKLHLRGYLVREDGGVALYADKTAAQLGWRTNALRITSGSSSEVQRSLLTWDQSFVEVKGQLVLSVSKTDEYWAEFAAHEPVFVAGVRGRKLKH